MWIPPEDRNPTLAHYPGRKSTGYFGAVRLRDGRFIFRRETEKFNAESFLEFMKQLLAAGKNNDRKMELIIDNAKYHHANLHKCWREENSEVFSLNYLPPYSPDLNPIERVWKLTRRNCLHNRYFPTLKAVETAVESQFDRWAHPNDILCRLCAFN